MALSFWSPAPTARRTPRAAHKLSSYREPEYHEADTLQYDDASNDTGNAAGKLHDAYNEADHSPTIACSKLLEAAL